MSIGQKLLPRSSKRSSVGRSEFWGGGANSRQSIDHVPSERQVFSAFSLNELRHELRVKPSMCHTKYVFSAFSLHCLFSFPHFLFWQVKDRLFIYRVFKCFGSFSLNQLRHEIRVKPSMCHTKYVSNKVCETKY